MIKSKNLLLICALSFFILNVGYSVYFFKIQNILSIFKIEEKINYFEDLKIYFPDIDDLIVTEISSSKFAIKGVIKNNETIYNIIDYVCIASRLRRCWYINQSSANHMPSSQMALSSGHGWLQNRESIRCTRKPMKPRSKSK